VVSSLDDVLDVFEFDFQELFLVVQIVKGLVIDAHIGQDYFTGVCYKWIDFGDF